MHAADRALAQRVAAAAEELSRPTPRAGVELAGAFDQAGAVEQAAKILLVQRQAGYGFDKAASSDNEWIFIRSGKS